MFVRVNNISEPESVKKKDQDTIKYVKKNNNENTTDTTINR